MFEADEYKVLNIAVDNYEGMEFRGKPVPSLPAAKRDHAKFRKIMSKYKVEITDMLNPEEKEVTKFFCKIALRAADLKRVRIGKRRTKGGIVLIVYFAGHGCMIRGSSHILFNAPEKNMKNPYPLEKLMRDLCASTDGVVFPICLFDCCRELISEKARNLAGDEGDAPDLEQLWNIVLVFACPPGKLVSAESNFLDQLAELLEDYTDENGELILPGILSKLTGKNRVEVVMSAPQDIRL